MNKRNLLTAAVIAAVAIVVFIALLPTLVMQKPVKDWITGDLLARQGIDAAIDDISIGWFRPTSVTGVAISPVDKPNLLKTKRIESDRSIWKALTEGVDSGKLTIEEPEIHVWTDEDGSNLQFPEIETATETPATTPDEKPAVTGRKSLEIEILRAALFLKTPTLATEVNVFQDLNINGELSQDSDGRTMLISPARILDHSTLSPELIEGGLKYILPVLAESTWTKGEFSIELDACVIDLDHPDQSLISGTLYIHGIQAGIRNELIATATNRIAARLGQGEIESIHLADNSAVKFQMRDGMVWHDGVEFGLPRVSKDLVVRTSGSVAFDETIDMTIDLPMPLHLISDGPLARALTDKALSLRTTGTLKDPKVAIEDDDFVGKLLSDVTGEMANGEQPIRGVFQGLRDALSGRRGNGDATDGASLDGVPLDEASSAEGRAADGRAADGQSADAVPDDGSSDEDAADITADEIIESGAILLDRLRERRQERGGIFQRRRER